jgi:asparagine synthase (glutamine-hydrolysing)
LELELGGFYVVSSAAGPNWREQAERIDLSFREQGFGQPVRISTQDYICTVFGKLCGGAPNLIKHDTGDSPDFVAAVGTMIVGGQSGQSALAALGDDDAVASQQGTFAVLRGSRQRVRIHVDPLGLYKVYFASNGSIVSSSFLAITSGLSSATISSQGLYEYVFQGATYGGETILEEVSILDPRDRIDAGSKARVVKTKADLPALKRRSFDAEESLGSIEAHLRSRFRDLAKAFSFNVDTALSGGYDSRLVLALLRSLGVSPRVHVYGAADDIDVRVAKLIAEGEGFELQHVDKSAGPVREADWPEVVRKNFLSFDGLPTDGIFDNGMDLATRRQRVAGEAIALNGGGGEILRNFFYLRDKRFKLRDVVHAFYCQFDPRTGTDRFDHRAYLSALEDKLASCLPVGSRRMDRTAIEWLYPYFRCRFWMGRNSSVNNRLGYFTTPLVDFDVSAMAANVPIKHKMFGAFQRSLLCSIDPDLARYPSAYGFPLDRSMPLTNRLAERMNVYRPVVVRRYAFRIKRLMSDAKVNLQDKVISQIFQGSSRTNDLLVDEYIDRRHVSDGPQLRRALTAEYYLRHLGSVR